MALIKDKLIKGINCLYHKIVDCDVRRGIVCVADYVSKEAAQVRENMIGGREAFNIQFPIDVTNPISYAYTKIVESKKDGDGNEANWYADAVNDDAQNEEVVDGQE